MIFYQRNSRSSLPQKIALRAFVILLLCYQAQASNKTEAWTLFLTQKKWSDSHPYSFNFFTMPRHSFDSNDLYQNLIGLSGLYRVNKHYSLALGYLHDVDSDFDLKEKRPFFDLLYSSPILRGKILIRSRMEYQVFQKSEKEHLRWRLMGRYDFSQFTHITPFIANEILVRLKDQNWKNQMGFSQNRLFLGGRKTFRSGVHFDAALLFIFNPKSSTRNNSDQWVFAPFIGLIHLW